MVKKRTIKPLMNEIDAHAVGVWNDCCDAHLQEVKRSVPSVGELLEIITDYASTHPHRDWSIGINGYDKVDMATRRQENLCHWKDLATAIHKLCEGGKA